MLMLMFFAFAYARAGFVPHITSMVSCQGNGSIIFSNYTSGGYTAPFTVYVYNPTTGYSYYDSLVMSSTDTISGLTAGSYQYWIYPDNNFAVGVQDTITITGLALSITTTPAICPQSNGTASVSASGGTAPYAYVWMDGNYNGIGAASSISGEPAGYYYILVRDHNGCVSDTTQVQIQSGSTDSAAIHLSGSNCSLILTAVEFYGVAPYSYYWSTGDTGATIAAYSGITGYSVTITDANGCSATAYDTAGNNQSSLTAYIDYQINPGCSASNGSITADAYGGVPPYTYLWSTGATGAVLSGVPTGSYNVTVTDASGCIAYTGTSITGGLNIDSSLGVVNPSCGGGGNNGSITPDILNGTAPYTYQWTDSAFGNVSVISGLSSGYYGVTVTDATGCSGAQWFYLSNPSAIAVYLTSNTNPSSCSATNGAATVAAYYGTSPYTYLWSTGATGSTLSGVGAGQYTVTATDAPGCTAMTSVYLSASLQIDSMAGVVYPTCGGGGNNGSITPSINGAAPYTYQWSDSAVGNVSSISGLSPGYYGLTVIDATGCSGTQWFYLPNPSQVNAYISNITIPSNCAASNGSISAVAYGGTAPYTFHWSTGSTDSILSNIPAGQYNVTVTDASGCSAVGSDTLNAGLQIATSGVTNPTCGGSSFGSIAVTVLNGTGPYTYQWSDSTVGNAGTIHNLSPGYYEVTVTDATGCSGTQVYYINSASNIYAYIFNTVNPGCGMSDGSMYAYAYNGSGSYTYHWSNGDNNDTITNLPAGTYTLTVTDVNGCIATTSATLVGQSNYTVTINTTPTACDTTLNTGTATAVITGGTNPPYSFAWSVWNNSGYNVNPVTGNQQTISNLPYGTYITLIVTDANGCVPTNDSAYAYIDFDSSCYDHIIGYVFNDSNGNCLYDPNESGVANCYVVAQGSNGQYYYANPNSSGFYDIEVTPGVYTVSITLYNYGSCANTQCVNRYIDTFTAIGQVSSGNNFGISGGGGGFDLGVHPGCYPSSPGSQKEYWVYYYNQGYSDAYNAVVSFTHDPNLTLVSTSPAYSNYNSTTHLISWFVGTVSPYNGWSQITMEFDVPSTLTLGTILYGQAEIDPISGDCDPSNNIVSCSQPVTGSQDPNEKSVSPAGNLSASDSVLTYTIRFQNVGNAPANTIVVVDTLSPNVNPASVVPGASSAPYTFSMSGRGIMTFTFQAINLPDSSHGGSSIGFVTYTVHTKPNLALGTTINNTAYVYFDANPAVVTNTTINERSNVNGIRTVNGSNMSAEVIPNPAHDIASIEFSGATGTIAIQITDELGNVIATANVNNNVYALNAAGLASGIYFYSAHDANGNKASGKISVVH